MSYLIGNTKLKNQYENLNDDGYYKRRRLRSVICFSFMISCIVFAFLTLTNLRTLDAEIYFLFLNQGQPLLHTTSPMFLSLGLDTSLLRLMDKLPISDEKFINLASHLSPAFVRIGGTSADCLFFEEFPFENPESNIGDQDITNFTIKGNDFFTLYQFTQKSRTRMLFDLNVLIRNPDGSWNHMNADRIITFARKNGMDLDWHLGNEPNSFNHVFKRRISPQQLGKDYSILRSLLNASAYEKSLLVGPEVNHIMDPIHPTQSGEDYAREFLMNNEDSIDYFTWHQYYLNGRKAKVEDFLNPLVFNILAGQIKSVKNVISEADKSIPMWLSETSSAFGGGAPELSNRFVAGFLFLDKLGICASAGVQVVIRQSFFGGNYSLIGSDLVPNPDWWVAVLYKKFVSNKVLKLSTANNFGNVRLYAHCTPESASLNGVSSVTVYGMNLNDRPVRIIIQGMRSSSKKGIFLYALTSDHLQSRIIRINGEELKLKTNGDLPVFKPIVLETEKFITLSAHSMAFIILHGMEISACSM